jgi:hypothetical protein
MAVQRTSRIAIEIYLLEKGAVLSRPLWIVSALLLVAVIEARSISLVVVVTGTIVWTRSKSLLLLLTAGLLRSISWTESTLIVETSVVVLIGMTSDLKFLLVKNPGSNPMLTEFWPNVS